MKFYSQEDVAVVWKARELTVVPQQERISEKPLPREVADLPARLWIAVDGGNDDTSLISVWYEVGDRAGTEALTSTDYAYVMAIYERAYAMAKASMEAKA